MLHPTARVATADRSFSVIIQQVQLAMHQRKRPCDEGSYYYHELASTTQYCVTRERQHVVINAYAAEVEKSQSQHTCTSLSSAGMVSLVQLPLKARSVFEIEI